MLHPTVLRRVSFFYALGNTPAVCLTRTLAPGQPANLLLLGCGDPRDVLYTVYESSYNNKVPLRYDFTCCDLEPAVLARNALLFTLIADSHESNNSQLWNIFYHFHLDKSSSQLLQAQAKTLASLSNSISQWHASKYGQFLRMCDTNTLSQLRRLWQLYAKPWNVTSEARYRYALEKTKQTYNALHENNINWQCVLARAAGPLFTGLFDESSPPGTQVWSTGIISDKLSDIQAAKFMNPTFLYTGAKDELSVHYGTNPVLGFHLAGSYADLDKAMTPRQVWESHRPTAKFCQFEFKEWCSVFKKALVAKDVNGRPLNNIHIRFFAGDALAFSRALSMYNQETGGSSAIIPYIAEWSMKPLRIDGCDYQKTVDPTRHAPTKFDVINTSNLTDHVGLLNILLSTACLLDKKSTSVLYTESFYSHRDDQFRAIEAGLGGNISLMSLLFDLAPLSYLAPVTGACETYTEHAAQTLAAMNPDQEIALPYHQLLSWRIPCLGDHSIPSNKSQLEFPNPSHLAHFLFSVYLALFAHEDLGKLCKLMERLPDAESGKDLSILRLPHYTRGTFAYLVRHLQTRLNADWRAVLYILLGLIEQDRQLIVGLNYYQELRTHLALLGVMPVMPIITAAKNTPLHKLLDWDEMPAIVSVTIVVPETAWKIFKEFDALTLGTPALQAEILSPPFSNAFSSIYTSFGTVRTNCEKGEKLVVSVEEDPTPWTGKSSMIVSWNMPSSILLQNPQNTMLSLQLMSSLSSSALFMDRLGPELKIYSVPLLSKQGIVFISRSLPNIPQPWQLPEPTPPLSDSVGVGEKIRLGSTLIYVDRADNDKIDVLSVHGTIGDANIKSDLARSTKLLWQQESPCTTAITLSEHKETIAFPYPVDGSQLHLSIDETLTVFQVNVPIAGPWEEGGYNTLPLHMTTYMVPWNIHRLNLDILPPIDLNTSRNHCWLKIHLASMLDSNNIPPKGNGFLNWMKDLINKKSPQLSARSQLLEELHLVLESCTGLNSSVIQSDSEIDSESESQSGPGSKIYRKKAIYISSSSDPTNGILILAIAMRLDLASHTVVLDSCVLIGKHGYELLSYIAPEALLQIESPEEVMYLWKLALLAYVERCRDWGHVQEKCQYYHSDDNREEDDETNTLCSCSEGKIEPWLLRYADWGLISKKARDQVRRHGVRAAISPLFPGPFAEGR